jgi:general L-amino acid transport system permease protein
MTAVRDHEIAFVRTEDAPLAPPPSSYVGVNGWLLQNLVTNWWIALLAGVFALLVANTAWNLFEWAVLHGVFNAENREGCIAPAAEGKPLGACWAYARARFPQWIYGFYPIPLRWRPNVVFFLFIALLVPLLIPKVPGKALNAALFFVAFPILSFYLLYGTPIPYAGLGFLFDLLGAVLKFIASLVYALGFVVDALLNILFSTTAFRTLFGWIAAPFAGLSEMIGRATASLSEPPLRPWGFWIDYILTTAVVLGFVAWRGMRRETEWRRAVLIGLAIAIGLGMLIAALGLPRGLSVVETPQWGGLLVTLVVAVTGIVASLPLGILLALGRRSNMPAIRLLSITFIETVRGVPLITVLFMASVMLPLFLPAGVNFDKLLRALVGVALFSSAYMAEVVRGGLQAIPKGQYEAAQALGLSYWKMMVLIVLPQALKIVIPGIVNSFISLFKDTVLVSIVGLFDLLGIVQAGFADQKWVSPMTAPTGYFGAAMIFFIFCFAMSRYSMFLERRLARGYKR